MIQRTLDRFLFCRRWLVTMLAYLSFRIYASEVHWEDLWNRTFRARQFRHLDLSAAADLVSLLSIAKDCAKEAESRRAAIGEKFKLLLTLSSVLLALIALLCPTTGVLHSYVTITIFGFAALFLLNVITLLLSFAGIGTDMVMTLDQDMVSLSSDDVRKSSINTLLLCQTDCDNRTDYLVELYKVTRFFFFSAFVLVGALAIVVQFSRVANDDTERIVRRLRSDPALIELIRGPKGIDGRQGEKGEPAKVDISDVVSKVLNDPRFKRSEHPPAAL